MPFVDIYRIIIYNIMTDIYSEARCAAYIPISDFDTSSHMAVFLRLSFAKNDDA